MACRVLELSRSSFYYSSNQGDFEKRLLKRLHYLCSKYSRYGYRRIHALLRQEGWSVNKKRIQRLMRQEGLRVLQKGKKRRRLGISTSERKRAEYRNHVWSWDFVFDRLEDGRSLKTLTIVDEFSRECLSIAVNTSIKSLDVIEEFKHLIRVYGIPSYIRSDNGPEFIAKQIVRWLKFYQVGTMYITPGSPWENAYIESFNGKFRDECLNMEIFSSIIEARIIIDDWRREYNEIRPHSSLGYMTPSEFAKVSNPSIATLNQGLILNGLETNFKNCTKNGVRSEPMSRDISDLFQNLSNYKNRFGMSEIDIDQLIKNFHKFDFEYTLEWFDKEFKNYLNIDVYENPFPHEKKYQIIKKGMTEILLMRTEDLSTLFYDAMKDFMGINFKKMIDANVGKNKEYSKLYTTFKNSLPVTKNELDKRYNTKYTRHFYTNDEILQFRNRWMK